VTIAIAYTHRADHQAIRRRTPVVARPFDVAGDEDL
jgi:hypothetical protein